MYPMNEHSAPKALQISQIIKDARLLKGLKQEQLAEEINVSEDRVVRMWELGERTPSLAHKKVLVSKMSIQPELLGLQEQTDFSPAEALSLLASTQSSFNQGTLIAALSKAELLVRNLSRQAKRGDANLHLPLIRAYYLRGMAISIVKNKPSLALNDFKEMEYLAREIEEQEWLYVARMYQAEMYRRMREYQQARLIFTEVAEALPDSNKTIVGHHQQLLARVRLALDDSEGAMEAM